MTNEQERIAAFKCNLGGSDLNISVKSRIFFLVIATIIGLVLGFVMKGKVLYFGPIGGLALGGAFYLKSRGDIFNKAARLEFNKRISFFKFIQLIAPQLSRLETEHVSLFSILKEVRAQIDEPDNKKYINNLMTELDKNPANPKPYYDFAHNYGQTDAAETLMASIYKMNNGSFDRQAVKDIAEQANANFTKQTRNIMDMKVKKFNPLSTKVTMLGLVVLAGYFATMVMSIITSFHF